MQKKTRPRYPRDYRERAAQLTHSQTIEEVAEELGVSKTSVVRWRAEFGISGTRRREGALDLSPRDMKNRLLELEREVAQLKKEKKLAEMEREILKKATVFFAKENG